MGESPQLLLEMPRDKKMAVGFGVSDHVNS
jgi:hypothetical protein